MIRQFPYYCAPKFVVDDGAITVRDADPAIIRDGRMIRRFRLADGTCIVLSTIVDGSEHDGWTEVDSGDRVIDNISDYLSNPPVLQIRKRH